jgi:16S rRNA (cytidine1402-2'-O)-methyltransferase
MRIGVKTPLIAYHDHNERTLAPQLTQRLLAGDSIALVSDAGMPLISDPGWLLVSTARQSGVNIVTVPGPCAATAALSISGLPTDHYVFEGFLPRRTAARAERLQSLAAERRTLIFYEAVHRIGATLAAMCTAFGPERQAVLARELTKLHETCYSGSLETLLGRIDADITLLGEFVIVVAGAPEAPAADAVEVLRTFEILAKAVSPKQAVALTAELTGRSRNDVYRLTRASQNSAD